MAFSCAGSVNVASGVIVTIPEPYGLFVLASLGTNICGPILSPACKPPHASLIIGCEYKLRIEDNTNRMNNVM